MLLGSLVMNLDGVAWSQGDTPAGTSGKTFTISGSTGLAGVTFKGFPAGVQTDGNGVYRVEVPHGWKGTVTPMKTGYSFVPANKSYYSVNADYKHDNYTAKHIAVTISGNVGLPGVVMQGLPGNSVTDSQGCYRALVNYDWSGTVTPVKEGFSFTPPARQFSQVARDQTDQDYIARHIEFKISGNVGIPGVVMKGLPGDVISDERGTYVAAVPYAWSGKVTANRPGYAFEPVSREYVRVAAPQPNQDYTPARLTFTISGNTGVAGVLMRGVPGEPVSGPDGRYRVQVEYGWTGVVAPEKAGYAFTPPERSYVDVTENRNDDNYAAELQMCTISDVIAFKDREPIQGVTVVAEPGGYSAVTDAQGRYRLRVPHGWSGRLTMTKPGFDFVSDTQYSDVRSDIIDGRYVQPLPPRSRVLSRAPSAFSQTGSPASPGAALVIPTAETAPERIAETTEDMRVMSRILQDKLSEPRMILGVLRDYGSFFDDGRTVEAFYLQGTAVVFVVQVDFPYSFPARPPEEGKAEKEPVDPVWERARQKLHSPTGSRAYGAGSQPGQTQQMTFEQFKDELLRSLKHAANLRNIEPNELIILTVVAQGEDADWSGGASMLGQVYGDEYAAMMMGEQQPAPATTVLTMQAKKADIDAFAKGQLDFEQFQQKAKAFTY